MGRGLGILAVYSGVDIQASLLSCLLVYWSAYQNFTEVSGIASVFCSVYPPFLGWGVYLPLRNGLKQLPSPGSGSTLSRTAPSILHHSLIILFNSYSILIISLSYSFNPKEYLSSRPWQRRRWRVLLESSSVIILGWWISMCFHFDSNERLCGIQLARWHWPEQCDKSQVFQLVSLRIHVSCYMYLWY